MVNGFHLLGTRVDTLRTPRPDAEFLHGISGRPASSCPSRWAASPVPATHYQQGHDVIRAFQRGLQGASAGADQPTLPLVPGRCAARAGRKTGMRSEGALPTAGY